MRLFQISIIGLLLTFFCSASFAQKPGAGSPPSGEPKSAPDFGTVTGKIVDDQGEPIGYVNVTLMKLDSTVVNGDLTDEKGSFTITPTGAGKFILRIQSLGLATKYLSIEITVKNDYKDLGKIKLTQGDNQLKSVDVVAEKPVIEMKVDKKVFNVEKNLTSAGGSVADVLANVPSVSVDADGNISVRGKSAVTILIDGKPSTMLGTGSDVASALQSMPASSVDNIEVITNPSAQYDASGTTGIINIITKKDNRFGMNGNVALGGGTRDKYNGNFGLNAHQGKWNFFVNGSFRLNSTYNDVTTNLYDTSAAKRLKNHTFEHVPRNMNGSFNNIGASWDPDKYNSISFTQSINLMHFGFRDYSNYNSYDSTSPTNPASILYKYTDFYVNILSLASNVDYKHKFKKKGEEISFDLSFTSSSISRHQFDSTGYMQDTGLKSVWPATYLLNTPATADNTNWTMMIDYSDPLFTENGKLSAGIKSQILGFSNSGTPTTTTGGVTTIDNGLLSIYNFTNQINAAYINWNDQVKKFSYQVGLRVEENNYHGNGQVPNDTSYRNSFFNFFPSAFVSYQLANQQSIYLNYSRRTNYPDFRSMLPFKDFSNPGTVNMGNPGLIPEFSNNIEFSYSKATKRGDNFILSAYYNVTDNLMQRFPVAISGLSNSERETLGLTPYSGELLNRPVNVPSGTTYGVEGTGHIQFYKWWEATVNANAFQNDINIGHIDGLGNASAVNSSGFGYFGKINTNIKLPKGFTIQINYNYESQKVVAEGLIQATNWMDIAVRKNLLKNKATIVLNCADVFKSHIFVTDYSPYPLESNNRLKETRIGTLTFTYRFGKMDNKQGQKREKPKNDTPTDKDHGTNLKDGDDSGGGDQGGGGQRPGGGR